MDNETAAPNNATETNANDNILLNEVSKRQLKLFSLVCSCIWLRSCSHRSFILANSFQFHYFRHESFWFIFLLRFCSMRYFFFVLISCCEIMCGHVCSAFLRTQSVKIIIHVTPKWRGENVRPTERYDKEFHMKLSSIRRVFQHSKY